jgi:hypothetical protein
VAHTSAFIDARRLAAFRDRIVLRDLRGRSARPSLVPVAGGLAVQGPFQIRQRIRVDRARGVAFADATGDMNPIHREADVVPGAFVAAAVVSAGEILFPRLRLEKLRASFTDVSWYDRSLRLVTRCTPRWDGESLGLSLDSVGYQDQRQVVSASLQGTFLQADPQLELALGKVDATWLMRVVQFYASLGIDAEAHFHKSSGPDLSYPIAFLASLPSGSMVERFQGEGGILNRLTLEFGDDRLPVTGPPEVSLELPKRLRASFNRIVTRVKEGMRTAVQGSALVLPRPPGDLFLARPEQEPTA